MTPSHGTIYTPNWPLEYPENASCVWTFNPPPTKIVRFFFTSFELDGDHHCDPNRAPEMGDQISINGELGMQHNTKIFSVFLCTDYITDCWLTVYNIP